MAALLGICLGLAGCAKPEPAHPAMWEVTGARGEHGWLFGTIHTLAHEAEWRSPVVSRALDSADVLVLEIAAIDDEAAMRRVFDGLSHSPGLSPLAERIDPKLRPALDKLMRVNHVDPTQFADVETWAAALMLAGLAEKEADPGNGIDRAIVEAKPDLPRSELEGTLSQLSIFDHMAEADQRVMLNSVLRNDRGEANLAQLANAWRKGDLDLIARETRTGMMADPQIRKALFTDRNAAWDGKIEAMLRAGHRPFVAVGAAHLAGPDALPAILAAHGWKVTRVQ
ncbi:MAG: TraB/GumN family protein [Novosphingobium sp.]